ncbi:MAG: hypothetical protein R6V39_01710 [Desulfovibrionales bacterium]
MFNQDQLQISPYRRTQTMAEKPSGPSKKPEMLTKWSSFSIIFSKAVSALELFFLALTCLNLIQENIVFLYQVGSNIWILVDCLWFGQKKANFYPYP